jgi:hypothetical protein
MTPHVSSLLESHANSVDWSSMKRSRGIYFGLVRSNSHVSPNLFRIRFETVLANMCKDEKGVSGK